MGFFLYLFGASSHRPNRVGCLSAAFHSGMPRSPKPLSIEDFFLIGSRRTTARQGATDGRDTDRSDVATVAGVVAPACRLPLLSAIESLIC